LRLIQSGLRSLDSFKYQHRDLGGTNRYAKIHYIHKSQLTT